MTKQKKARLALLYHLLNVTTFPEPEVALPLMYKIERIVGKEFIDDFPFEYNMPKIDEKIYNDWIK